MHHQIDSLAYTNRLRYLPPQQKLLFALALFCLSYITPASIRLVIAGWLILWTVGYAGIPIKVYLQLQAIPLFFWLASLPALALSGTFLPNLPVIRADVWQGIALGSVYLYVSKQGILQAGELLTRAFALTSCMYFILLTIPFVEILRILKQLRCPSLITELLALMYRFIFALTDTVVELLTAQNARLGYNTWHSGMRSLGLVVSQLLWRTLENYRQISLGLTSRGFTGELRVWYAHRYKPNPRYLWEAVAGCLILVIITGWHHAHRI